jgi:hypothetical protein
MDLLRRRFRPAGEEGALRFHRGSGTTQELGQMRAQQWYSSLGFTSRAAVTVPIAADGMH